MEIELSHVTTAGIPFSGRIRFADEDPGGLPTEGLRFPGPLDVEGRARRLGDLYVVEGRIRGRGILQCGRCLADVDREFDTEFTARFAPQSAAPRPASSRTPEAEGIEDESGVRLEDSEMDISFLPHGAHALVVDDVVREQVLLDLPLRALCRPDCRGLCPRCGADLNAGPCGCSADGESAGDLRLAALADIRKKLEGS